MQKNSARNTHAHPLAKPELGQLSVPIAMSGAPLGLSKPAAGEATAPLKVGVIGSGISGLSGAWLLAKRHRVTLFEADARPGGHSHTVDVTAARGALPVDTGFIVYNESAYPNLTALFEHLAVSTRPTIMSFGVSLDDGALEYAGTDLRSLFAQPRNVLRPRFWSMLRDIARFYRQAPADARRLPEMTLADYLDLEAYGRAFREDHLYPMAAAIWSIPAARAGDYPLQSFVRFCENHHLLQMSDRPAWRTVVGGSREYVKKLVAAIGPDVRLETAVSSVRRADGGVMVATADGHVERFDRLVIATHADQALRLLDDPSREEQRLLGAFGYSRNHAVLHGDDALMPRRRATWSSWNYAGRRGDPGAVCVTYWMNRLQHIEGDTPLFVTLNPSREPHPSKLLRTEVVEHPMFNQAALAAQRELWTLQGHRDTWYCGAYFGSGFHEDGLQAGLAVAEAIGGERRPWRVAGESDRITIHGSPLWT